MKYPSYRYKPRRKRDQKRDRKQKTQTSPNSNNKEKNSIDCSKNQLETSPINNQNISYCSSSDQHTNHFFYWHFNTNS